MWPITWICCHINRTRPLPVAARCLPDYHVRSTRFRLQKPGFQFNLIQPAQPTILDRIKWNSKPPCPPNQAPMMKPRKSQNAPFSHPWFWGSLKWNNKLPCPPNQAPVVKPRKSQNAPFSHPWFWGSRVRGGGTTLFKIVGYDNIVVVLCAVSSSL